MGSDPKTSVVNRYGQTWDIPVRCRQLHFSVAGRFNPALTVQVLADMTADAIVNRCKKSPGTLL